LFFFQNNNAFIIPPDSTYIRVKVGVDYVGNGVGEESRCEISERDDFQLLYPGYLPLTGSPEVVPSFLLKIPPCLREDYSFWIDYIFPALDFELEKMLFSVNSIEQRPWNFWRLVKE